MSDKTRNRRVVAACIVVLALVAGPGRFASATFFDLDGVVQTCNAFACNAAGIDVGDPIGGFIEIEDAASGPNSTFTEADLISWELTIGALMSGGDGNTLGPSMLTTDSDGEIVSGTADFSTTVDTGIGIAEITIIVDADTETWAASTTFLGLGEIATGTLSFTRRQDADGDGIGDSVDNCTLISNADQRDTNGDLFGNVCDPDLNDDGIVNAIDLGLFKSVFFSSDPDADFDGDGIVNVVDLGKLKSFFFAPPGPSGLAP